LTDSQPGSAFRVLGSKVKNKLMFDWFHWLDWRNQVKYFFWTGFTGFFLGRSPGLPRHKNNPKDPVNPV